MPVDQELAPLPGHLLVNSRFTHVNKVFLVLGEMDVNDLTDELRLDLLPSRLSQQKKRQAPILWNLPLLNSGEPSRARTCDPLIKSQLLYQLSYRPSLQTTAI